MSSMGPVCCACLFRVFFFALPVSAMFVLASTENEMRWLAPNVRTVGGPLLFLNMLVAVWQARAGVLHLDTHASAAR